jgi:hypothetical protein
MKFENPIDTCGQKRCAGTGEADCFKDGWRVVADRVVAGRVLEILKGDSEKKAVFC